MTLPFWATKTFSVLLVLGLLAVLVGATKTIVDTDSVQTISNKVIDSSNTFQIDLSSPTITGTISSDVTFSDINITGGDITGITDLAVADGGTGASTAAGARTNLELVAGGAGDIWVEKAGDTMTGLLTLSGAPTTSLHAATKAYVDAAVGTGSLADLSDTTITSAVSGEALVFGGTVWVNTNLDATYLTLAGGTMTGVLTLSGNPTTSLQAATKQYADAVTPTALASNPSDCSAGQFATTIDASGNLTCAAVSQTYISSSTVGTAQLKLGTGSSSAGSFAVNQYAFSSPTTGGSRNWKQFEVGNGAGDQYINWVAPDGGQAGNAATSTSHANTLATIGWDYVTASENPKVWAEVAVDGTIGGMWESEDPANPELPDDPPVDGLNWVDITDLLQDASFITKAKQLRASRTEFPKWKDRSVYKNEATVQGMVDKVQEAIFAKRGYGRPADIATVLTDQGLTSQRKNWRIQLWLRGLSKVTEDHTVETMIPYVKAHCKVLGAPPRLQCT